MEGNLHETGPGEHDQVHGGFPSPRGFQEGRQAAGSSPRIHTGWHCLALWLLSDFCPFSLCLTTIPFREVDNLMHLFSADERDEAQASAPVSGFPRVPALC